MEKVLSIICNSIERYPYGELNEFELFGLLVDAVLQWVFPYNWSKLVYTNCRLQMGMYQPVDSSEFNVTFGINNGTLFFNVDYFGEDAGSQFNMFTSDLFVRGADFSDPRACLKPSGLQRIAICVQDMVRVHPRELV